MKVNGENIPYEKVAQKLAETVTNHINHPQAGLHIVGAIQNLATMQRVKKMENLPGKPLLTTCYIANPTFADARVC